MIVASFLEMASVGFLIPVVSIIIDGDLQNSYINLDFLIEITQNFTNQELMLFVFSIFALLFLIKFLFTFFFYIKKVYLSIYFLMIYVEKFLKFF